MGISITSTEDPAEFLAQANEFLFEHECENNTILSIASQVGQDGSLFRPPFLFVTVSSNGKVCGVGVHALPDGLVMSDTSPSVCRAIVDEMALRGIKPQRLFVDEESSVTATERLGELLGVRFAPVRRWSFYYTEERVQDTYSGPGILRTAEESDEDTVRQFGLGYQAEKDSIVDVCEYFLCRLREGNLHLWTHPGITDVRTVVATSGKTQHVVRIAGVYTPPNSRHQGYAASAIARVTNDHIGSGFRTVTLCVDQSDEGARLLYERLGFKFLYERVELMDARANLQVISK